MAKKRITRKKLLKEPDEFITATGKMIRFVNKYKIQVLCAFGIFFAFIIIISGIRYFSDRAENEAFFLLEQGIAKYENIMKKNGLDQAYDDVKNDFKLILEKYSGKNGGKLARIIYANICYNTGDFDEAIILYRKALEDFDANQSLKNLTLSCLGYSYGEKKDYQAAIEYFEMIVSGAESIMKDEALFNLGWLYGETGKLDKSVSAYKKIISEFTDSVYYKLVKEKVGGYQQ